MIDKSIIKVEKGLKSRLQAYAFTEVLHLAGRQGLGLTHPSIQSIQCLIARFQFLVQQMYGEVA